MFEMIVTLLLCKPDLSACERPMFKVVLYTTIEECASTEGEAVADLLRGKLEEPVRILLKCEFTGPGV